MAMHENAWYFRKARRLLAERATNQTLDSLPQLELELKKLLTDLECDNVDEWIQLRLVWTIHALGVADETFLLDCADSPSEHVRAWSVRLLADGLRKPGKTVADRFEELARTDPSGLVRLYLAGALNRFDGPTRLRIAHSLCQHEADARDRTQPHLIWFGVEPVVTANWPTALKLAAESKIPLIRENIVRRVTSEIETVPEAVDAIVAGLQIKSLEPVSTLRGMSMALDGWATAPPPENWIEVSTQLLGSSDQALREAVINLGVVFGDGRAVEDLRKIAMSDNPDVAIRRRAIASWAATKPAELEPTLKELIHDRSLTTQVVKSMVFCESPSIAGAIIDRYPHMNPEGKSAAIDTLVARDSWSLTLLDAVQSGQIPRDAVTAYHAGRMNEFFNEKLHERLQAVWGTIRSTSEEKAKTISELTERLLPDGKTLVAHDAAAGRALFAKNCSACHTLFGTGGNTGPDLTGGNRQNLELSSYQHHRSQQFRRRNVSRSSVIALDDGRLISGLILNQNEQTVRIQTPEEIITISKDSIDEIRNSNKSVMPDGLLTNLTDQQKADLIGYLMSPSQVPLPATNVLPDDQ